MDPPTLYIIDASSLIVLGRHRPANRYVRVWQRLDELIHNERLISPDEVYDELRAGKDSLAAWAKQCKRDKRLFKKTTRQVADTARQLISRFPDLVDVDRPIPQADPFVVALAVAASKHDLLAPPCAVVTEEKYNFTGKPRLPNVCGSCKMPYLTIHQLFINEGWSF